MDGLDNFSGVNVFAMLFHTAHLVSIFDIPIHNLLTQSLVQSLFRRALSIMFFQVRHDMFTGEKLPAETTEAQTKSMESILTTPKGHKRLSV